MQAGDVLQIEQRQRGFGGSAGNRFHLQRQLWLTFDRTGYLAKDDIAGRMVRDWRLDLSAPLQLQSANLVDSYNLLVTQNPGDATQRGVEVRTPSTEITAVSRLDDARSVLPVSGWQTNMENVITELYLPPGTRLIAAPGSDSASGDWAGAWNLLDFFVLLIISVALWRLYTPWLGVAAFVALSLSMHENNAPLWSWVFLVGAFAAHRALPEGRLRRAAGTVKLLSVLVIAIVVVPFAAQQLKLAVYPQLERQLRQGNFMAQSNIDDHSAALEEECCVTQPQSAAVVDRSMQFVRATKQPSAAPAPEQLNRYAKSAQVQAGPGVPQWRWRAHRLTWSGPVAPDQTFRLIILPSWALSLWRIVMVLLTLGVIGLLIKRDPPGRLARRSVTVAGLLASVAISATLLTLPVQQAHADVPTPQMLEELERRLLKPENCAPRCVNIERAAVRFDASELRIEMVAHALAKTALHLPGDPSSWHGTRVTLDGTTTEQLVFTETGFALPLETGVHRIELRGPLPNANAVTLAFRVNPHQVTVTGSGFEVTGLNDGKLPGGALTLIRQRTASDEENVLDAIDVEQFPAFVTVERALSLGLDWIITTTVKRVTPALAPINLQIPLLDGESVTSEGMQVSEGQVSVNIGSGQAQSSWTSRLERRPDLTLTAADNVPWQEHWVINAGASWRLTHSGVPEDNVNRGSLPFWRASFTPWPGEVLQLNIVRPTGIDGPTLAIEKARLKKFVGRRGSETSLEISYRATKGGQHAIQLPADSVLIGVTAGRPPAIAYAG